MNMFIAAFAAVLVQPLVFLAWTGAGAVASGRLFSLDGLWFVGFLLLCVVLVAAVVVGVLWIPTYLVLRAMGRDQRRWVAAAGFTLAASVVMPLYWSVGLALFFGIHGLVGALTFRAVLRRRQRRT